MSVIKREDLPASPAFNFSDLEGEARALVARARIEAEQLLADARRTAAALQQQAHTDAEQRRRAGYEEGLRRGREAGFAQARREAAEQSLAEARAEIGRLTSALAAALAEYDRRRHALLAAAESGLIELAVAIARRVCHTLADTSPEPAAAAARALLERAAHHGDVTLHVHPAEFERLRQVAAEFVEQLGRRTHVQLVSDPQVTRGGCVLRTAHGVLDAALEQQLDRVAAALCGHSEPNA